MYDGDDGDDGGDNESDVSSTSSANAQKGVFDFNSRTKITQYTDEFGNTVKLPGSVIAAMLATVLKDESQHELEAQKMERGGKDKQSAKIAKILSFNAKNEISRLEINTPVTSQFVQLLSCSSKNQDDKEVALAHCLLKAQQTNYSSLQQQHLTHHLQVNGATPTQISTLSRSGLIASRSSVHNLLLVDDGKAEGLVAERLSQMKYGMFVHGLMHDNLQWKSFYSRVIETS